MDLQESTLIERLRDAVLVCRDEVPREFWARCPEYANLVEEALNDAAVAIEEDAMIDRLREALVRNARNEDDR